MDQLARSAKQIGAAIRRRRRAMGLTQAELGKRAALRQATISAIEAGEAGTQLDTLFALLAALDLELAIRTRTKAAPGAVSDIF